MTTSPSSRWPAIVVVAATTMVTGQFLRLLYPLAYGLADRRGNSAAAGLVLVVGLAPLTAPLVRRVLGGRRAVAVTVMALALWRLVATIPATRSLAVAAIGVAIGLTALTVTLAAALPGGGDAKGIGVLGGVAADAVVLAAWGTWDPIWRSGAGAVLTGVAVGAFTGAAAWAAWHHWDDPEPDPAAPTPAGGVAVGLAVGLEWLFLANPGFLAAAVGVSPGAALVIGVAGVLVALLAHTTVGRGELTPTLLSAAVLGIAGFFLPVSSGVVTLALVVAAQLGVGSLLARALAPARSDHEYRAEVGLALGWFGALVTTLLFQVHYDAPLPVSNRWVVAGAGLLTALAAGGEHTREPGMFSRRVPAVLASTLAVATAAVAIVLAATEPGRPEAAAAAPDSLRVVQWNVRQAVDEDGNLDPEAVADAIERAGPVDVVVLNEVGRGWPLSGSIDLAAWLSRRLDLPFRWGPAASDQFGNLVLSRLPVVEADVEALTVDGNAQGRSLVTVTLDAGNDRVVTVLATHLQHRNSPSARAARLGEIGEIIERWGGEWRTVLAGDLNPAQGDPPDYPPRVPGEFAEIAALLDAGFVTAADLGACTTPTSGRNCSDWVFVTADLRPTGLEVVDVDGFDHRMLVADIALG